MQTIAKITLKKSATTAVTTVQMKEALSHASLDDPSGPRCTEGVLKRTAGQSSGFRLQFAVTVKRLTGPVFRQGLLQQQNANVVVTKSAQYSYWNSEIVPALITNFSV